MAKKSTAVTAVPEILVFAPEPVQPGSAFGNHRPMELCRVLARADFRVTFAVPNPEVLPDVPFKVTTSESATIGTLLKRHTVIISTGVEYPPRYVPRGRFVQVFDLAGLSLDTLTSAEAPLRSHYQQLLDHAGLVLCATPYQRDFWLGAAAMRGRLSTPEFRTRRAIDLVAVVPFGYSEDESEPSQPGVKGVEPGIGRSDSLIVWNAGYAPFLEPQIAISAMRGLGQIDPRIKMLFLPPQPGRESEQLVFASLQESARENGLLGTNVITMSDPPSRARYRAILREASAVIACASNSADNRLWHGAPAVDAVGVQAPVLCTRGSFMATLTEDLRLGYTMAPGDPVDVAEKIARVCDPANSDPMRSHLREVASHFSWENAGRALLDFLRDVPDASGDAAEGGWRDSLLRAKERLLG